MRYADWPKRLNDYIHKAQKETFEWGTHDCCTFSAGAVQAILEDSPDYMEEFRGKYDTEIGAYRALKEIGKGTLEEVLTEKFGEPVLGVKGQRGDIAMYENCVGLILGKICLFAHDDIGYRVVPLCDIDKAFRVE